MSPELDKKLCEKYSTIFVKRNASARESCMHWGFECGDGWYNILDSLCAAMSATYSTSVHITKREAKRVGVKETVLKNYPPVWRWPEDRRPRRVLKDGTLEKLPPHKPSYKEIFTYPPKFAWHKLKYLLTPTKTAYFLGVNSPKVIADQVKEKFGTLRFYYHLEFDEKFTELAYGKRPNADARKVADGYQSYYDGIVHMAEVLSAQTCEETGRPGVLHRSSSWVKTLNVEVAATDPRFVKRGYEPANIHNYD